MSYKKSHVRANTVILRTNTIIFLTNTVTLRTIKVVFEETQSYRDKYSLVCAK